MKKHITVRHTNEKVLLEHIPAFRQAFVIAATLILAGLALGQTISEYFFILTALVSGGLLFSGLVGWCPMALILERMPWNKKYQTIVESEDDVTQTSVY